MRSFAWVNIHQGACVFYLFISYFGSRLFDRIKLRVTRAANYEQASSEGVYCPLVATASPQRWLLQLISLPCTTTCTISYFLR